MIRSGVLPWNLLALRLMLLATSSAFPFTRLLSISQPCCWLHSMGDGKRRAHRRKSVSRSERVIWFERET